GRRIVVAVGGNALIRDPQHQSVQDQYEMAAETDHRIAALVQMGLEVTITHGNGPQVGFILRRSELAATELHEVPLEVCVADTQGAIGYALQQNLYNDFRRLGIDRQVASVVTQVEVDPNDPAFDSPIKPIGGYLDEEVALRLKRNGWTVIEDPDKGWRRVVASPLPRRIVEAPVIRRLMDSGFVVIALGGGGIPVARDEAGNLRGVAAVVDKDLASALLASDLDADILAISTTVERVALNYGSPQQRWIDHLTLQQAREFIAEGIHFGRGSMAPKIQAIVQFLEAGGSEGLITNGENLERAVLGEAGTRITR
ncbi:MAG: carbamate kinase, partial [Rhodothermales bacterium]|nr:carbamate kinase [Rhodothermales bacterium]